jgi:hypothetical protein
MAFSKTTKIFQWLIGAIVLMMIVVQIIAQFIVSPTLEETISHFVSESSNQLYQVDSLDIDFEYFDKTVIINDFHLTFDSSKFVVKKDAGVARPSLIDLFIPRLELRIADLYQAYEKKNFFIDYVDISQPEIHLYDDANLAENRRTPPRVDQLYQLIAPQIKGLYINSINIEGGKFYLNAKGRKRHNTFSARDIAVSIDNFRLDSTTVPELDRPFYADQISASVNISDYSFVFPDSSYAIQAGKLGFDTQTGEIYAEELELQPGSLYFSQDEITPPARSQFHISVPRLQIVQTGFHRAYFDRNLHLGSIELIRPLIRQMGKINSDSVQSDDINTSDLYQRIKPIFDQITVDKIVLKDGNYQRISSWDDSLASVSLDGIELSLNQLRLDSTLLQPDRRLLFSEEIELKLSRYQFSLSKNNYTLSGQKAFLSSISGDFSAQNLKLVPREEKYQGAFQTGGDIIFFQIPALSINGLNLPATWHDRILEVSTFSIENPTIEMLNLPKVQKETVDSLAQINLYNFIADIFSSFTIRRFKINNGKFNFNSSNQENDNEFRAQNINVRIRNFTLSPEEKGKKRNPFYADDIDIKGDIVDYSFILPDSTYAIQAQSIGISTADSAIFADSIQITSLTFLDSLSQPENQRQTDVMIPRIYLSGLDISQIWFNRFLDIDSIGLSRPVIRLESSDSPSGKIEFKSLEEIDLYPYISKRLNALKVKTFQVDSASLLRTHFHGDTVSRLELPLINLRVSQFFIDSTTQIGPDNLLYADDIAMHLGSFSQLFPDSSHKIWVEAVDFSTREGEIGIANISILPMDSLKGPGLITNRYEVLVPSIDIQGVNAFELYEEKVLDVDKVRISDPHVALNNYPEVEKEEFDSLARSDLYLLIADQLNSLQVRSLMVLGGKVNFNEDNVQSENTFVANDIMVLIRNFQLDSAARAKTDNPFYADDIDVSININDYSFLLSDSTYSVKVGNIGISTADSSILAERIEITPQLNNEKLKNTRHIFDLYLPSVRFKGYNTNELYFDREMALDSIEVYRPQINMFTRAHLPAKDSLNIYEAVSREVNRLAVNKIIVKNGVFDQVLPEGSTERPLKIKGFSLELDKFELDSLPPLAAGRFIYSNHLDLKIDDYAIPIRDSAYTLGVKTVRFSTRESSITMDSLSLTSNFEIKEFVNKNGYAIDHITLRTHRIKAENMDLFALADRQSVDILKLWVEGLKLKIDKDKRAPARPNKRPPLPVSFIRSLPFYLRIDSTFIPDGKVTYQEKVESLMDPGELVINQIDGVITQLTNDSTLMQPEREEYLGLEARAKLMNQGDLSFKVFYPLFDTTDRFTLTGKLDSMSMTSFNPLLEPGVSVSVKDGWAQEMTFRVRGDREACRGKMWFRYRNLKVEVFNEKETDAFTPTKKKRGLLSIFANTMVVHSKNPTRRFLRVGKIEYDVDRSKAFIAHWVQSLLSGLKSSIGLEKLETKDKTLR